MPLYPCRQVLFTLGFLFPLLLCTWGLCHNLITPPSFTNPSPPSLPSPPSPLPLLPPFSSFPPSPPSPLPLLPPFPSFPPLCTLPVFITLSICNHNVSEFLHHCLSTFIHKLQCSLIVWFLKTVPIGKSEITIN